MAEIVFALYKKIPNPRTCVPLPPSPQPPPVAPTRPLPLPPQICRTWRRAGRAPPIPPRSWASRREAKRRRGEIGSDQRASEQSKLACFVFAYPNPHHPLSRRWTSWSISSSARPGESSLPIRVFWVWIWAAPRRAGSVVLQWGWWTGAAAWLGRPSPGVGLSGRSCTDGPGSRIEFAGGSPPFGFEAAQLSCDLLLVLGLRVIVVVCVCVCVCVCTRD
jgi:hypothetical protein